jgi:hypothetical protein
MPFLPFSQKSPAYYRLIGLRLGTTVLIFVYLVYSLLVYAFLLITGANPIDSQFDHALFAISFLVIISLITATYMHHTYRSNHAIQLRYFILMTVVIVSWPIWAVWIFRAMTSILLKVLAVL